MTISQMKIIHTGCSAALGLHVDKGANLGNRGWKRNFCFTHQFRLIGYLGAYSRCVLFHTLHRLWLRIEVALITSLGRQSFGEGSEILVFTLLVSPSWGLFPQVWVVLSKNHLFRPCDVLQN